MNIFALILTAFIILAGSINAAAGPTHVLGAHKQILDPSTDTVNSGYYSSTTLSAVDTDLSTTNIVSGVTIFGKAGVRALPDTGQSTSYTAKDDADYNHVATSQSYTDNGDGTIMDNRTGLMWKKCSEPDATTDCSTAHNTYTWANAITECENLTYPAAGYIDWRLPNVLELFSLMRQDGAGPHINATYFPSTFNGAYWTSTTFVSNTAYASYVDFFWTTAGLNPFDNTPSLKGAGHYVRCVRGGP